MTIFRAFTVKCWKWLIPFVWTNHFSRNLISLISKIKKLENLYNCSLFSKCLLKPGNSLFYVAFFLFFSLHIKVYESSWMHRKIRRIVKHSLKERKNDCAEMALGAVLVDGVREIENLRKIRNWTRSDYRWRYSARRKHSKSAIWSNYYWESFSSKSIVFSSFLTIKMIRILIKLFLISVINDGDLGKIFVIFQRFFFRPTKFFEIFSIMQILEDSP